MSNRVDYLVVGAGAMGMAFIDSLFHKSEATFAIVDRRPAPGGHWNDAYPYVTLHQPASAYGVASRPLGRDGIEQHGYNEGLEAVASGAEVATHFHAFVRDVLAPSGRVRYLPMAEHVGAGECVSLLSGERTAVEHDVLVDATMLETRIPLTHRRAFTVADGAVCAPPNDLSRLAPDHRHYAVLGAGKTGIDAVLWLLAHGAPPERISWVVPRDPWMINRASGQTSLDSFRRATGEMFVRQLEAIAAATSLDDLGERMEAAECWLRLDPEIRPTMQHCGTVTVRELAAARQVRDVIRLGRVLAIEPGRLVLEQGERAVPTGTLFVDCTANALAKNVGVTEPVFAPGRIALQMIRLCQPTFSASLIGHLEATIPDPAEKRSLAAPAPMPDTVADWVRSSIASNSNQAAWGRHPQVRGWLGECRLNVAAAWSRIPADDHEARALLGRIVAATKPSTDNLRRLAA